MRHPFSTWLLASGLSASFGSGCSIDTSVPAPQEMLVINFEVTVTNQYTECSSIQGVDIAPLEAWIASPVELHAIVPEDASSITWHASSGRFTDPLSADTEYFCSKLGEQVLTVTLDEGAPCEQATEVELTCSANPACGNGDLDEGEQCDDGNTERGDGCTEMCWLEVD